MIINEISDIGGGDGGYVSTIDCHVLLKLLNPTHKVKMDANTPFDSVLGTNFVPSESDVQLINDYLAQPLSELTQLDLEISRLQAKRDGIHTRIQPYQVLLSPIRRLPLDIMEKIFLSCLPTERNPAMSTLEAPLKLGRICSSWRGFAYSCPRLWARIHISVLHLGEIPEEDFELEPEQRFYRTEEAMVGIRRHLDGVSEWLARSHSHPLSISVVKPLHLFRDGAVLPLLQTLLPFSKQWRDLELLITWDDSTILDFSQHFSLLELPILRSVRLRDVLNVRSHFYSPSSPSPFKWLSTPSLRSFHALSLPSPLLMKLGIHWLNLTELSLLGPLITSGDAASLLNSCANIVKCGLQISYQSGSVNFPERIELPRLESLTFYERVGFPVFLHLPNIHDLSFASDCQTDIPRFDLPGILSTSHSLTTLTLDLVFLPPDLVLRSLSCASSLKCLIFSKWTVTGKTTNDIHHQRDDSEETMAKVIEALTPTESDDSDSLVTTFCPNLETLECENWAFFSDEALETMIIRRTSARFQGSILRRVAVNFLDRPMTIDLWETLDNVVDEYFELELEYLTEEPDMKISAWSGVGTAEMVPEWALDSI